MNPIAKWLIWAGVFLILFGLLWQVGGKWLNLGRLPGDIIIKKENFSLYFPIVTCLVLSLLFSLIVYLFRFFR